MISAQVLAIPALEREEWAELGVPLGHRARIKAPSASRPKDISAFLAALELPQYAGGFVANGVDFLAIPALERDDWVELGVPIGHRARIIKEHKALHPEMW